MGVKISGLETMQKQLKEVEKATEALNGSYDVHFDANDPVSIENAIQEAYSMVHERASGYATNPMVSPLIEGMKENLRQQILDSADNKGRSASRMAIDIFQSLKNCVFDLQRADVQNYQQPLKQLARLLKSESLEAINARLTRNIVLDDFLTRSEETESSMAGSAVLQWPEETAEILGLKLVLIDKMAADNNFSFNFCHTFFYDRNILESIRKFTSSLVGPFVRDYQIYV